MVKRILITFFAGAFIAFGAVNVAFAWHPKAEIIKKVQNVTTNGAMTDANDDASAVTAKPGDTLKYSIEVKNNGTPNNQGHNDLHFTVLTDTLPVGVELISDPAKREIKEDLGILKPGKSVVKEYLVKVISQTNDQIVTNKACVEGDSEIKDAPQHDCDPAKIKVVVEPKKEVLSEEKVVIPATGPESVGVSAVSLGVIGYAVAFYIRSKRHMGKRTT